MDCQSVETKANTMTPPAASTFSALPGPGVEIHQAMPATLRETHEDDEDILQIADRVLGDEFDAVYECWCGAKGKYSELCDLRGLEKGCGGSGSLACYCGGDLCVCHHHGEAECPGCSDCREDDDEGDV